MTPAESHRPQLPSSLAKVTKFVRLGDGVPALVAHPDWSTPAPAVIWMHGRTVNKELDPGRYLRWVRAGIAAVALDLPGHGERFDRVHHSPSTTLDTVAQMVGEIDAVVADLPGLGPFDPDRLALGGMSAGGMATLRRLCDPHAFVAAAVESTSGDLAGLYFDPEHHWGVEHDPEAVKPLDPAAHLETFSPIPLLVLHNDLDEMIPVALQRGFVERLRGRYAAAGADPDLIDFRTFGPGGAPQEHSGFGRNASEAKNIQTDFLRRVLGIGPATPDGGIE